MPYIIKKVNDGYKVCKRDDTSECFSKKGMPEERAKRQMRAIGMSEMKGGLKPLTARVGGKVLLKKKIVDDYFPKPDTYSTYVEPFVGGGSIYFYANKDDHKEVVNDIDPYIYELFKGFQKFDGNKIADDINGDYTSDDFKKIMNSNPTTPYNKFLKTYLLHKLSFFGRGTSFGKSRISAKFNGYKERLKDTTILKEDYKDVIKKYDSKSTFFYLDPPIRPSSGEYHFPAINIEALSKIVKSIKGKFLLSLADTTIKKELFKDFKIITIPTKYVGDKTKGGQTMKVNEYLIMNYEPRMKGGMQIGCGKSKKVCHTCYGSCEGYAGGCEECGGSCGAGTMAKFHRQLEKLGLDHNKYMKQAMALAKASGYDPSKLSMAEDGIHKLCYDSPEGKRCFGRVDYADYIIWSWMEHKGDVEKGTADNRRKNYRKRAMNIRGDWAEDKYSPNNLAINILW